MGQGVRRLSLGTTVSHNRIWSVCQPNQLHIQRVCRGGGDRTPKGLLKAKDQNHLQKRHQPHLERYTRIPNHFQVLETFFCL